MFLLKSTSLVKTASGSFQPGKFSTDFPLFLLPARYASKNAPSSLAQTALLPAFPQI